MKGQMDNILDAFKQTDAYKIQSTLEARAADKGDEKVKKNVLRLEEEQPSSITPYGNLIEPLIGPLAQRLKAEFKEIIKRERTVGGGFPAGFNEVKLLEVDKLSRTVLDTCLEGSTQNYTRQQVLTLIGKYVENLDFERLGKAWDKKKYTKSYKKMMKARKSNETRDEYFRAVLQNKGMKKIEPWGERKRARVGGYLWNALNHLVGNVFYFQAQHMGSHFIALTKSAQKKLDDGLAHLKRIEEPHPLLITGPCHWDGMIAKCYLSQAKNANTKYVTVRNSTQEKAITRAIIDGSIKTHLDADNIINRVPVSINKEVHNYLNFLWDKGESFNPKFPKKYVKLITKAEYAKEFGLSKPFKEWDKDDQDAFKKRRQGQHKQNRKIKSYRRLRDLDRTEIKAQYLNGKNFGYLIVKNDFRGRRNILQYLNYQREDLIRGQMDFGKKQPLNEDGKFWMAVDIASLYGEDKLDKAHPEIAAQWTLDRLDGLKELIDNPNKYIEWVKKADKPVQFLRAAFEFVQSEVDPDYATGIPCYADMGASGMTFIGGIMQCSKIGHFTNITAGNDQDQAESPYHLIGEGVTEAFKDETDEKQKRKIKALLDFSERVHGVRAITKPWTKRPTMTWPYSATRDGFKNQSMEDVIEPEIDRYERREIDTHPFEHPTGAYDNDLFAEHCAQYLGRTIEDVLKQTFPMADNFMQFIVSIAQRCSEEGVQFQFTSPDGFPLIQPYVQKDKIGPVELPFRDNILNVGPRRKPTMSIDSYSENNKILKRKAKNGASPNVIHCLDSTLLSMIINRLHKLGIYNIFIIHDAIAVHPNYMDTLHKVFRECFIELVTQNNILQNIYDQNAWNLKDKSKLPDVPKLGDLDVSKALLSPTILR